MTKMTDMIWEESSSAEVVELLNKYLGKKVSIELLIEESGWDDKGCQTYEGQRKQNYLVWLEEVDEKKILGRVPGSCNFLDFPFHRRKSGFVGQTITKIIGIQYEQTRLYKLGG